MTDSGAPDEGPIAGGRSWPLEPDPSEMRAMLEAAAERVITHVESLPEQPSDGTADGHAAARAIRSEAPDAGRPLEEILELLFEEAIPRTYNTASGSYLAYIPGGGLYASAVAALISSAVNRYMGVFAAAPPLAQIEADVVRWFARFLGYPDEARGFLTGGGSQANFCGLVAARRERLPDDFLNGVLYVSDQAHHSVLKAAVQAGFSGRNVRSLESDDRYRMDPDALREAILRDRADGLRPFLIVASAGTTNTGAVDPLPALAGIAREEGLWLHVDAAYGGFFALTDRGRERLEGLERADSVVVDPHKSLFLPYGCGCLLVRDGEALRRVYSLRGDYMPPAQEGDEFVDFCEISPELSRRFRGLEVWLPMQLHGLDAFRDALAEKFELSDRIHEELAATPGVEIVASPQLTVTAWRLRPDGVEGEALDRLNRRLLKSINARGNVYLTGTRLDVGFVLRVCVLSHRTHRERIEIAIRDIRSAIEALSADWEERCSKV